MENCQQFDGFSVTYRLEVPDKNMSVEVQSCYTALSIAQAPDEMWGLLYVNDTEALRRPECQDLQYVVVAQEAHTQQEASTQVYIILDSKGEGVSQGSLSFRCKENILPPHITSTHSMPLFRGRQSHARPVFCGYSDHFVQRHCRAYKCADCVPAVVPNVF